MALNTHVVQANWIICGRTLSAPPPADLVIVNMYLCESLVTIGMNRRL